MKERILEELRRLGREEEENLLAFAAERSVSMMQAYCSREDLPQALWSVGVALAQQLLDATDVKSIQEGDVSVAFAEGRKETELLNGFRTELDRFRRADW